MREMTRVTGPGEGAGLTGRRSGRSSGAGRCADLVERALVDRRLANRNLRTALVAGSVIMLVFALSFLVGLIY